MGGIRRGRHTFSSIPASSPALDESLKPSYPASRNVQIDPYGEPPINQVGDGKMKRVEPRTFFSAIFDAYVSVYSTHIPRSATNGGIFRRDPIARCRNIRINIEALFPTWTSPQMNSGSFLPYYE